MSAEIIQFVPKPRTPEPDIFDPFNPFGPTCDWLAAFFRYQTEPAVILSFEDKK